MNFTYLLLALSVLLIPLILLLISQTGFRKTFRFAIPAMLITGIVAAALATILVLFRAWVFNPEYLMQVDVWKTPVEDVIFTIAFSFAGISIYATLNNFFPDRALNKYTLAFSNLLLGVCIAMLFFTYTKWYSAISFGTLLILLFYVEYLNKLRFMYHFYRAYLVCLVLFYGYYGVITALPVISYQNTINIRVGNIPFEGHFYTMMLLLLSVYFYEFFKSRAKK